MWLTDAFRQSLLPALHTADKNVALDLSASTRSTNGTFNTGVTSTVIPDGMRNIVSIVLPDTTVTGIGSNAFWGCTALTSIVIPDSVTSIGSNAFNGCTGLTSITIPDSVTTINANAFINTGIFNNTPDNSVVYADKWAVGVRGSVSGNLTLRADIVGIGGSAFEGNTALTSIVIPDSVMIINVNAFNGCTDLTSVTFDGATPPTRIAAIGVFNGTHTDLKIFVPAGSAVGYRAVPQLNSMRNRIHSVGCGLDNPATGVNCSCQ
jgi:hypothetical protein